MFRGLTFFGTQCINCPTIYLYSAVFRQKLSALCLCKSVLQLCYVFQVLCSILASDENICREAVKPASAADDVVARARERCAQIQH